MIHFDIGTNNILDSPPRKLKGLNIWFGSAFICQVKE